MVIFKKPPFFRKRVKLNKKGLKEAELALPPACDLPQNADAVLQAYFRTVTGSISVPKKAQS